MAFATKLILGVLVLGLAGCCCPNKVQRPCVWPCGHPESAGLDKSVCHSYPECLTHPEKAWWLPGVTDR